ncbi:MAG: right-handed parallel beta-helix repeat-containing protein [Solirubrobacteraceae bacterium]
MRVTATAKLEPTEGDASSKAPRPTATRVGRAVGLGGLIALLLPAMAAAQTLVVTTTADSKDAGCTIALCSFRDALGAAKTGDTIMMGEGTYKATMTEGNGVWSPDGEYTIQGAGAGKTIIDANKLGRAFAFYGDITVSGVTVTGGIDPGSGCGCGGGFEVRQGAFLTLLNSVVEGNSAGGGGGIDVDSQSKAVLENVLVSQNSSSSGGGGIRVEPVSGTTGTLAMTNVTISGNSTTGSSGAGLDNQGSTTATNITINGNQSSGEGGGILNASTGALVMTNATIAENIAHENAPGIRNLGSSSAVALRNTIVADGCSGTGTPAVTSQGHNLDAGTSCGFAEAGDISGKNPLLGALQNNGGAMELPTMALAQTSPALDAANNAVCPTTDERGVARPHGPVCDIGAFELSAPIVTAGTAGAATERAATVAGSVNPSGFATTARIEYGTTTAYGSSTSPQSVGAGTTAVQLSAALAALTPGTTYHFRIVAGNRDGTTSGPDATFATTKPAPAPAPSALVLSALKQSASKWREGSSLPRAASPHSRKPPVGTTFSFTLNEAATVQLAFTQRASGRKVGHKCLAQTHANRHKRSCSRTVTAATLVLAAHAGTNTLRFQGRVSGSKKLKPGPYTLVVTGTGPGGKSSAPQRLTFTIVK